MDRQKELTKLLNEHCYYYYVLDDPRISDGEFDRMYDELAALEKKSGVVLPDSPTKRVGGQVLDRFQKHRHLAPLYSLDKVRSKEEIAAWWERLKKFGIDEPCFSLEYKFDGLTLNLTYDGGELKNAATRGDGTVGEEILTQVLTIRSVPLSIPFRGRMEVQGEGIMPLSELEKYNKAAPEPLKNARNGVAGALRNLDTSETAKRNLDAYFYNVGYIEGREFENHGEMIEFLRENRFKVSGYEKKLYSIDEVIEKIETVDKSSLDFLIDGMVIKLWNFDDRERAGFTQKFPRWAVAYKFAAEEATTTVADVIWEVGRTGKLTPIALLDSVEIGGATIRRATLNNYSDILRKQVGIGSEVFIRRSNDVIPEILGIVTGVSGTPIEKPSRCPSCGTKLEEIGPNLFCPNSLSCRPQIVARMAHYVSRDAMNMETISEKTIELFVSELGIGDIADLYKIRFDDLMKLPKIKETKAQNILNAIEGSKSPELENFIFALGINNVGKKTAKELAERFGSLERLAQATEEELLDMDDVGPVVARCIQDFFHDPGIAATLFELRRCGVIPKEYKKASGVFDGKKLVITGTLKTAGRREISAMIEAHGGVVMSAVGKSTDFLVAGENGGSKLEKASALGVSILTEEEFLEMIGEGRQEQNKV